MGITGGVQASAGILNLLLGIYPPLLEEYQQFAFSKMPNKNPDLGTVVEMYYKGKLSLSELQNVFKAQGIKPAYAEGIADMSRQFLSVGEYLTLWRREEITEGELDGFLRLLRFNDEGILQAKKVSEFFPAPADLVQFAVREVYTPSVIDQFGLMEDIPPEFIKESKKAGLPEEQARNYWGAHWNLPSSGQGFEMFQRDIIKEDTLKLLLKSLDITPFWREQLIKLSYTPLTRVDIRRMHAMDILDDTQTYDAYRYRGYSPVDADSMLKFTKMYNSEDTTGLTRSSVLKAYKKKLLSRGDVNEIFQEFNYAPDVIAFWMDMTDLELELDRIAEREKDLKLQNTKGKIDLGEMKQQLDSEGLPSEYVDQLIDDQEMAQSVKLKLATKQDLTDWLRLQIIDDIFYSDYMKKLGYQPDDILLYLTEFELTADTSERKYLPIKTYQRWLSGGIIDENKFIETAQGMSIEEEDIYNLITEVQPTGD